MKYTITIEETVAKDFEIEANSADEAYETAEQKYKDGEFIDYDIDEALAMKKDIDELLYDLVRRLSR